MRVTEIKYTESPVYISNHFHDCHQMLYIARGEIFAIVEGEKKKIPEGSILVLNRFEEHSIVASSEECHRFTLRISDDGGELGYGELGGFAEMLINRAKSYGHIIPCGENAERVRSVLCEMKEEAEGYGRLKECAIDLHFSRLMLLLYRGCGEIIKSEGRDLELIRIIKKKLEGDYGEKITLSSLSQEFHISPSYLSHIFKRETGYAPIDYLMAARISVAKRLLSSTDKSVKEIVYLCGFGDESNFSRIFKKRTTISPTQFRRKYGANN